MEIKDLDEHFCKSIFILNHLTFSHYIMSMKVNTVSLSEFPIHKVICHFLLIYATY